jgi:thiazole synthase/sulfur carrier protein
LSLIVNGKSVDFVENESVEELLKRLRFTFPLVIVKINGKHIQRSKISEQIIPDEADIKVIHMISGG